MVQVLAVDDDPDLRVLLRLTLLSLGHEPVMASRAAEAYMVCALSRPDALLLDLSMPEGDGLTLLEQLRADGIAPHTVVLLSAQPPENLARIALEHRIAWVGKPYSPDAIAEAMRAADRAAA